MEEIIITEKIVDEEGRTFIKIENYFNNLKFKYEPYIKSGNCFAQRHFPKTDIIKNYIVNNLQVKDDSMEFTIKEINEIKSDLPFYPILNLFSDAEVIK